MGGVVGVAQRWSEGNETEMRGRWNGESDGQATIVGTELAYRDGGWNVLSWRQVGYGGRIDGGYGVGSSGDEKAMDKKVVTVGSVDLGAVAGGERGVGGPGRR